MPNSIFLLLPIALFIFWTGYVLWLFVRGLHDGKVMRRNMFSSAFKYIPGKIFTRAENPVAFWAFIGLYFVLAICGVAAVILILILLI
ncbi:MAG: hypothetical protein AAB726_02300 [Patescibacteria group bacterium]